MNRAPDLHAYSVRLNSLNVVGSSCSDEVENLYSISEQLGLQPQWATESLSSLSIAKRVSKYKCNGGALRV